MQRRALLLALALILLARPLLSLKPEEKKKGGGQDYIQIPTLTATLTRPDGRRGVLTVETGVDVPDKKLHDLADSSTPRLRAAYANVVMTYAASLSPGYATPNRRLSVARTATPDRPGFRSAWREAAAWNDPGELEVQAQASVEEPAVEAERRVVRKRHRA